MPGIFHQRSVLYSCGTCCLTCMAIQTKIHLINELIRQAYRSIMDRSYQTDPSSWRRFLTKGQIVRRAHRQTHAAVNATVQNFIKCTEIDVCHCRRDFRRKGNKTAPVAKPPMCAQKATPPTSEPMPSESTPLAACIRNQMPRNRNAGSSTT